MIIVERYMKFIYIKSEMHNNEIHVFKYSLPYQLIMHYLFPKHKSKNFNINCFY